MPKPSVIHSPEALLQMKEGIDTLGALLAITLGPGQGVILSSKETQAEPEMLSNAATIARRIISLPDRRQDVGAMLLRNLVWRVSKRVGDGGATTAVMTREMFEQAFRFLSAGVNHVALQQGLRRGAEAARSALLQLGRPVKEGDWFSFQGDQGELLAVARSVTNDLELSYVLAEIFEILGKDAFITIQDYVAPYLEREYLQGGRWEARLLSPYLATTQDGRRAVLQKPKIVLYQGRIDTVEQVTPLLEVLADKPGGSKEAYKGSLLIVAEEIAGQALASLVAIHQRNDVKIAAVGLKSGGNKARVDFNDLATLTRATLIAPKLGSRLENISSGDLGSAQRIEAGPDELFVISDRASSPEVREQVEAFQSRMRALPYDDEERSEIHRRLGRLSGNVAILKIGSLTKEERAVTRQKAEQGIKALRAALEEGIVPGGGTAYLHCLTALEQLETRTESERMGVEIVRRGLEAPFRQILQNAKVDNAGYLLEKILDQDPGLVYDVVKGELTEEQLAGILDPVMVLRVALETATSGVAMAMSTETIVLKSRPRVSYEP